jgi:hypothetical protein
VYKILIYEQAKKTNKNINRHIEKSAKLFKLGGSGVYKYMGTTDKLLTNKDKRKKKKNADREN